MTNNLSHFSANTPPVGFKVCSQIKSLLVGIAQAFTSIFHRSDSLSILSRQSDLRTYSAESSCETFSVGQSSPLAFPFKAKSQLAFSHQSVLTILLLCLTLFVGVGNAWGQASTHSSNVTLNSGTNCSNCNVVISGTSYSGKKLGTGSNTGSTSFIVPAGVTTVYIHAAKWNGESGNLNISRSSGTVSPTSVTLTADAGISGNGSTYTLSSQDKATTSYFFTLTLQSKNTETTITLTTSSKRAAVWGVNTAATCTSITPTLSYASTNLTIGGGNSSSPTLNKDGSSGVVTWSSSNTNVATVNSGGVVSPVGTGTCNITASIAAAGGKCAADVSVEFTVKRNITYYIGNISYTVGGIDGATLVSTLPANPTSCDAVNYPYFHGWKNGSISGSTTTAPTILSTETVSSSSAANTYYAVFTDVEPSDGWEKLTSLSASNIGDEVVFVYEGTAKYEMTGVASNLGTATGIDKIPDDIAGTFTLTIEKGYNNSGYSFKNGTKYIRHNADKKIELSTTKDALSSWTPSGSSGNFKLNNNNTTSYNLQFNSGSPRWTDYSSSQSAFQIYKRTAGGTVNYITTCCQPLGSINGSVNASHFSTCSLLGGRRFSHSVGRTLRGRLI